MDKKIIFFDADDTLFSVTPSVAFHYREVFAEHGHHNITEARLTAAHRKAWYELKDEYESTSKNHLVTQESDREFWREYSRRVACHCVPEFLFDGLTDIELLDSFYDRFSSGRTRRLSNGIIELLVHLSQEPTMTLGVFTNNDARVNQILKDHGIDHFFKYVFTAGMIGIKKPSVDVFHELNRLTATTAQESIYIGDSLEHDIFPARKAGWKAYLYDPLANYSEINHEPIKDFLHEISGSRLGNPKTFD